MRKLILLLLFIPLVSFGQDTIPAIKLQPLKYDYNLKKFASLNKNIERYKIYSTTNSYISLMLDTQTGKSWMVQIGIGEGVATKAVLNDFEYAYTVESAKEKYQQALKAWEENDDLDKEAWKPKKDFYKDMIGVVGQFKLYPTKNMFNFIMVNVIDGTTWQVQWSVDEDKRIINLIW